MATGLIYSASIYELQFNPGDQETAQKGKRLTCSKKEFDKSKEIYSKGLQESGHY